MVGEYVDDLVQVAVGGAGPARTQDWKHARQRFAPAASGCVPSTMGCWEFFFAVGDGHARLSGDC
jgi:hypothetical protein